MADGELESRNGERRSEQDGITKGLLPGVVVSDAENGERGRAQEPNAEILPALTVSSPGPLALQAAAFARAAKAPSTLRAYAFDWAHFLDWCGKQDRAALPATTETVALYLNALAATHRPATITRRLTAITKAHQARGLVSPATVSELAVGETLKGIRRTLGTAQNGKTPLLTADLLQILGPPAPHSGRPPQPSSPLGRLRGAFRRSELTTFHLEDVTWVDEGAIVRLVRSKTDQEGQGGRRRFRGEPMYRPVRCGPCVP